MNNILIFSQDGRLTCFARSLAIGARRPTGLIGDKLKKALETKKCSKEELIKGIGNSYRNNIERVLVDEEVPKLTLVNKITKFLELDDDYFKEKELENLIITDNNIVVGKYETNDRALEVKKQLDVIIDERYRADKPIVINMPNK